MTSKSDPLDCCVITVTMYYFHLPNLEICWIILHDSCSQKELSGASLWVTLDPRDCRTVSCDKEFSSYPLKPCIIYIQGLVQQEVLKSYCRSHKAEWLVEQRQLFMFRPPVNSGAVWQLNVKSSRNKINPPLDVS